MNNDKHICYELAKRVGHDFPVNEPPPNEQLFFRKRDDQNNVAYPNYLKDDERFFSLILLTLKAALKSIGILNHSGFDTAVFNTIEKAYRSNPNALELPPKQKRRDWLAAIHNGIVEVDNGIEFESVR
jgi:hypothetical protein